MIATRELQLITTQNQALQNGQLVSRVFTDAAGRSFRLTFFVSIVDGETKGRLVSAQEIGKGEVGDKSYEQGSVMLLPFACPKVISHTSYLSSPALFVSPYFSLDFLINSQPTRAPSRA